MQRKHTAVLLDSSMQVEINAVYPSHKSLSPSLRAFLDLAAEQLKRQLTGVDQ